MRRLWCLIVLAGNVSSMFPAQEVFPPAGGTEYLPLTQAPPALPVDVAKVGIQILDLLKLVHSRKYFLREISVDQFVVSQTGTVMFNSKLRSSFYWEPPAVTGSSNQNLRSFSDILLSLVNSADDDGLVPAELVIVRHRINSAIPVEDPYAYLAEPLRRLILMEGAKPIISIYLRSLTLSELDFFAFSSLGVSPEECVARFLPVKPGGVIRRFFRVSRLRRERHSALVEWSAISLLSRSVNIKVWVDGAMVPHAFYEERAILHVMKYSKGFPSLVQPGFSVSEYCKSRMIITKAPRFTVSLDKIRRLSIRSAAALTVTGLTLLAELHSLGIVHGSIGAGKLAINAFTKNPRSLRITDLSTARPWEVPKNPWSRSSREPLDKKSIFDLEGAPTRPRDDIYRFVEIILKLIGEPEFTHPRPADIQEPILLAQWKRKRRMTSNRNIPICFFKLLASVMELKEDDAPPYQTWIDSFSKSFP